ncbi:hypothetical protein DPMN_068621 [Dreissena polymorpha]|uniref:Uncharacterized protein n=1 Tax=Dreissena polymorpha TaxID=45954 RepID=A0A9D4BTR2_DREPO|nr:hypothetical protein DPMN_068621 [Dreissena polymorpha]
MMSTSARRKTGLKAVSVTPSSATAPTTWLFPWQQYWAPRLRSSSPSLHSFL